MPKNACLLPLFKFSITSSFKALLKRSTIELNQLDTSSINFSGGKLLTNRNVKLTSKDQSFSLLFRCCYSELSFQIVEYCLLLLIS